MTTNAHRIAIHPVADRVRVVWRGQTLADSRRALRLEEGRLPPVHYFPREDVRMDLLKPTDHGSHCPFKGDASYWSVEAGGESAENAVWSYEQPRAGTEPIREHVAFYRARLPDLEERIGD